MAQMSPATTDGAGRCCLPSGNDNVPMRSSSSWSAWVVEEPLVPKNELKWPDTCTVASGLMVPENTRTRLTLPTYGSDVVLTTSASSGPFGSQVRPLRGAPCGVKTSGSLMLGGGGESAGGDLQQLQRADAGGAAHRDHREERRPGDRLLEVLDQHRLVDLLAAEVALHQRLVLGLLDDSLDQGAAQFLDLVGVGGVGLVRAGALAVGVLVVGLRQQPDQTGAGRVGGQVERQDLVAERLLRLGQCAVVVGAGVVEFGDHHGARHADLAALHPQRLGQLVDALVGGDDEQRAVGGPQPGPQFADEIGVAGCVDQVDLDPVVQQRRQRQPDRTLRGDLRLVVVADRGAVDHGAGSGEYTGGDQKGLDECRLAATRWAHQHHVADGGRTVRGGGGSGARRSCRLVSHDVPSCWRSRQCEPSH